MSITIQQLRDLVADYWPSYRVNIDPMWKSYLRHHDYEKVKSVLADHRGAMPDEPRPIWNLVYAKLIGAHTLPSPDHERRELAAMQQRAAIAQHIVMSEVPDDERREAWERFVSEQPTFVQECYRAMGWERFPVIMAKRLRPDRVAEVLKSEPAPEIPPMKKREFLKAGWEK